MSTHQQFWLTLACDLAYRLPPPPRGERYVRVGADILLIAPGTSMVIDIMPNIGGY